MGHRKARTPRILPGDAQDPEGLGAWMLRFLEWLRVRNYSELTVRHDDVALARFLAWCKDRDLARPGQITRPILQRYQRHLFYHRKADGKALSFRSQRSFLQPIQAFFKWLTRQNVLPSNPAGDLEMPRLERRLPRHVLSVPEAERVLTQPDLSTSLGLRDRAMLETLYSTGLRRMELVHLQVFDLDRGTVMVRQGKGKKDRMVPIGEQAVAWCEKYLQEVRPGLVVEPDEGYVFLTRQGEALRPDQLTRVVRDYVEAAHPGRPGSCHLFRHAMATAMLENGADIRFIQEMLGHADLSTTQIYTQLSIKKLKEIHTATHPTARLERAPRADPSEPAGLDPVEDTDELAEELADAEAEERVPDEPEPPDEPVPRRLWSTKKNRP